LEGKQSEESEESEVKNVWQTVFVSLAKELEISFQEQPIDANDFTTEIPALCEVIQGGSTGSASLASAHTVCV